MPTHTSTKSRNLQDSRGAQRSRDFAGDDAATRKKQVEAVPAELSEVFHDLAHSVGGAEALAGVLRTIHESHAEMPAWLDALIGSRDPAMMRLVAEAQRQNRGAEAPAQAKKNAAFLDTLGDSLGLGPVQWPETAAAQRTDATLDRLFATVVDLDQGPDLRRLAGEDTEINAQTATLHAELLADLGISRHLGKAADVTVVAELGGLAGLSTPDGIKLAAGHFDPWAKEGRALLAHELAHVAQRDLPGTAPIATAEAEADLVMKQALTGGTLPTPMTPLAADANAACGGVPCGTSLCGPTKEEKKGKKPKPPTPDEWKRGEIEVEEFELKKPELPWIDLVIEDEPITRPPDPTMKHDGDCEACPEPAAEAKNEKAVRPTPTTPITGKGPERTLTISGHTIHIRLPENASAGLVTVKFREEDSPYNGVRFQTATLTLDKDLAIVKGYLQGSLHIGKDVKVPSFKLNVTRGGAISGSIENAVFQDGPFKYKASLFFGPEGIYGKGRMEWPDMKLWRGLKATSGFLAVDIKKTGSVTAHGKIGLEIEGIGSAELEACYVDGELRGSLTVSFTKEFTIIPGLLRVTHITAKGCLKKDGWRLTGSVGVVMRDWLEGEVEVTVHPDESGKLSWEVKGELALAKARTIGPLTINQAKLSCSWKDGKWAPLHGDLQFELNLPTAQAPIYGELHGDYNFDTEKINGSGQMELNGGLDLVSIAGAGLRMESAYVIGHIKDSELTEIEGAAEFNFMYQGLPTFMVNCERALYNLKTQEIHANGTLEVMRDVVLGNAAGLHGVFTQGYAGEFAVENGTLVNAGVELPFELRHVAEVVGTGGIAFSYNETDGLNGDINFGLINRLGLPDMAAGPVFIEPGGSAKLAVTNSALASAKLEGLQVSVANKGGGLILGSLNGSYDFNTGEASLSGMAWVQEEWKISLGTLGTASITTGGEATLFVTHEGIQELHGTLPIDADLTPPVTSAFGITGSIKGNWNKENETFAGDFETQLKEGSAIDIPVIGDTRVVIGQQAAISGSYDGTALTENLGVDCGVEIIKGDSPMFAGEIKDGLYNTTNGAMSFKGAMSLLREEVIALGGGRTLAIDGEKSSITVDVAQSVLQSAGGTIAVNVGDAAGALFQGRVEGAEISFGDSLDVTGNVVLELAREIDLATLGIPMAGGFTGRLIPGSALKGRVENNVLQTLNVDALAFLGWDGADKAQAMLTGTWDVGTGVIAGAIDAQLIEAIQFGPDGGGAAMMAWGLQVDAGSGFSAQLGTTGLTDLSIAFLMSVMRGGMAVAKGQLSGSWTPGQADSLSGNMQFAMLQAVDLGVGAGRFAVFLGAETQGDIEVLGGIIVAAGGNVVLALRENGAEKAHLRMTGAQSTQEGFSGDAKLAVLQPLTLAERVVGDHAYRVDLSTRTTANIGVENNKPTNTSGTVALDIAKSGKAFAELDATLDIDWSAAKTPVTVTGSARIVAPVDLGTAGDFGFMLDSGTTLNASIVDGGLESLDGALKFALTRQGERVANLGLTGQYRAGTAPDINGQVNLTIEKGFALFDSDRYGFGFSPSTFTATMAKGAITAASGKIGLYAEAKGGKDKAPLGSVAMMLDGSYVSGGKGSGTFNGTGAVQVTGDFPVAKVGDWDIVLGAGSGVKATVTNNKFTAIDGDLKGRVDQANPGAGESKQFLKLEGKVTYLPEEGGQVDAKGAATLVGDKKVYESKGQSVWLTKGGAVSVDIQKNKLVSVTGNITGEVRDNGKPLFSASVTGGTYSGTTGELSGTGTLTLLSSFTVPKGATNGFRLEVQKGTKGSATLDKGAITNLSGTVKLKVLDDDGALFTVDGTGEFDASKGILTRASGTVNLVRAFEVGGTGENAMLRVLSASGKAVVTNNKLDAIEGNLSFEVPKLSNIKGSISGGWRRTEDGKDDYWGTGTLAFAMPDTDGKGRSMAASLSLTIAKGGKWAAKGEAEFQLMEGAKIKVAVEVDQALDPIISASLGLPKMTIIDKMTLFKMGFDMAMDVPLLGIAGARFGISIGMEAAMQALTFQAKDIGFSNWRPLSQKQSVPTFTASLAVTWGFDFLVKVMGYASVYVGVGSALSVDAGMKAGLEVKLPININPTGQITGGKDGISGEFDLNIGVAPTAAILMVPFVRGQVLGDSVNQDLAEIRIDLGTIFEWSWGKKFSFGDKPAAPKDIAPAMSSAKGSETAKLEEHKDPVKQPTEAAKTPPTKAGGPNMGTVPAGPKKKEEKAGGKQDKLGLMMEALKALQGLMDELAPYFKMIEEDGISGVIKAIKKATGKAAWERICSAARKLYHAILAAFPDLGLAYSMPRWVIDIMESPEGKSLSLWDAVTEDDDRAVDAVKAGKHKGMPPKGRAQYVNALRSGSCGDADEGAIVEILRFSANNGDLDAVIAASGGFEALDSAIDGAENKQLRAILTQNGYFERQDAKAKAQFDKLFGAD